MGRLWHNNKKVMFKCILYFYVRFFWFSCFSTFFLMLFVFIPCTGTLFLYLKICWAVWNFVSIFLHSSQYSYIVSVCVSPIVNLRSGIVFIFSHLFSYSLFLYIFISLSKYMKLSTSFKLLPRSFNFLLFQYLFRFSLQQFSPVSSSTHLFRGPFTVSIFCFENTWRSVDNTIFPRENALNIRKLPWGNK